MEIRDGCESLGMISGRQLVDELIQRGIEVVVSVPCSLLRPLLAAAESSGELLHIPATSESGGRNCSWRLAGGKEAVTDDAEFGLLRVS